jgi:transposase
MPKRYHLNRPDLAQTIAFELRSCQDIQSQRRLLAARLATSGQLTAVQIADQLDISRRQFFGWMKALRTGGVFCLLERKHGGGNEPQVQGHALQELRAGLQAGRWQRAKEIQQWLQEQHAIQLKLSGVYYWLRKLGGGLKKRAKPGREVTCRQAWCNNKVKPVLRQQPLTNREPRLAVFMLIPK